MKSRVIIAAVLVLILAACGNSDASPSGVDPCHRDQALAYERAAEMAQSSIQGNVPEMMRATADMLAAAERRNTSQLRAAYDEFTSAADSFEEDGAAFADQMNEADTAC